MSKFKDRVIPLTENARLFVWWEVDEYPDLSELGEFTRSVSGWVIDRRGGWLLDENNVVVRRDLATSWQHGQVQYFKPGDNHLPHEPESWAHVPVDMKAEVIAKHGSLRDADIQYAIEDWQRMEAYERGDWEMWGCVCELQIRLKGRTWSSLITNSLWGIESDSPDHHPAIEADMIQQTKYEVVERFPEYSHILSDILNAIKGAA